jgi:hypothetical protein
MLANTWGRTVLPLGKYTREANVPGGRPVSLIQFAAGERASSMGSDPECRRRAEGREQRCI